MKCVTLVAPLGGTHLQLRSFTLAKSCSARARTGKRIRCTYHRIVFSFSSDPPPLLYSPAVSLDDLDREVGLREHESGFELLKARLDQRLCLLKVHSRLPVTVKEGEDEVAADSLRRKIHLHSVWSIQ